MNDSRKCAGHPVKNTLIFGCPGRGKVFSSIDTELLSDLRIKMYGKQDKTVLREFTTNIEKVDKIGRKYNLSRSAMNNIFLSQLTGNEDLE